VVWGKSDKLIPPVYADQFKKLIPQAEVSLIEQAGHMVPYEQPEAFVNAVTRFLG
jgi:pimeloyl-ACP methyl ester carboxylesterase